MFFIAVNDTHIHTVGVQQGRGDGVLNGKLFLISGETWCSQ